MTDLESICRTYSTELACSILELCLSVMPSCSDSEKQKLISLLDERMTSAFINYLGKHICEINNLSKGARPFAYVGQSFVNCDLRTGTICLLTFVRRDESSKWFHVVVSSWNNSNQSMQTVPPHGWTEYGVNPHLGNMPYLNIYWSHNGKYENKHCYLRFQNILGAFVTADQTRLLVPIELKQFIPTLCVSNSVVVSTRISGL